MVRREVLQDEYRRVMASHPTGVTLVTSLTDDGWPVGMTVGTFCAVSLQPPLVGFLPTRASGSWRQIAGTGSFCVNVLRDDQQALCRRFAARREDRFDGVGWRAAPATGAPVLDGVLAWLDCTIHDVADAGDHWFVMGRVHALEADRGRPMVFFGGALDTVSRPAPVPTA